MAADRPIHFSQEPPGEGNRIISPLSAAQEKGKGLPIIDYLTVKNRRYELTRVLPNEADQIIAMRLASAVWIAKKPNTGGQWQKFHGSQDQTIAREKVVAEIKRDIDNEDVYCLRDEGRVFATVTLTEDGDPILFTPRERKESMFASRLMRLHDDESEEKYKGSGEALLRWAEAETARRGKRFLRLSVWADNPKLQDKYENKWGYTRIPNLKWIANPAYVLFEKEITKNEHVGSYGGIRFDYIWSHQIDPFSAPDLNEAMISRWRDGTLYSGYKRGSKKPMLVKVNFGDGWGWLEAPARSGGEDVRTSIAKAKQNTLVNGNMFRILTDPQRTKLISILGLADFLVERTVDLSSYPSSGIIDVKTGLKSNLKLRAIEQPAQTNQDYAQTWNAYKATNYQGRGVLVEGTFSDGLLFLQDKTTIRLTTNDEGAGKDDAVVTNCYRPPTRDEYIPQSIGLQDITDGTNIMARLTNPSVDPGAVAHIQATVMTIQKPSYHRSSHGDEFLSPITYYLEGPDINGVIHEKNPRKLHDVNE